MEKKTYRKRMWKMTGKEPYLRGMLEHFSVKDQRQRSSDSWPIKAGRNTRSVAAGIASQGILGASELLPRHRLQRINGEERLHRIKRWNVGRILRDLFGKDESLRMGLRQDERGVRLGSKGGRKDEHCARDHAQKYGLLPANHCTRRRTRRCHNVLPVPELQQFPP